MDSKSKQYQRIADQINKELMGSVEKLLLADPKENKKEVVESICKYVYGLLPDNNSNIDLECIEGEDNYIVNPKNLYTGLLLYGINEPEAINKTEIELGLGKYTFKNNQVTIQLKNPIQKIEYKGTFNLK